MSYNLCVLSILLKITYKYYIDQRNIFYTNRSADILTILLTFHTEMKWYFWHLTFRKNEGVNTSTITGSPPNNFKLTVLFHAAFIPKNTFIGHIKILSKRVRLRPCSEHCVRSLRTLLVVTLRYFLGVWDCKEWALRAASQNALSYVRLGKGLCKTRGVIARPRNYPLGASSAQVAMCYTLP